MNKISIITVCMGRGHHLKETLPKNISDNASYRDLEFIVLDYNSPDHIGDWIRLNMADHIQSGLLKYYKTYDPSIFHLSHSRNMALKLASGDIICPVDADAYTGVDYIRWIASVFENHGDRTIVTTLGKDECPFPSQGGKLAFRREYVYSVRGYDEQMVDYGMEDVDLVNRLEIVGGRRHFIDNMDFLQGLAHSDVERLENFSLFKTVRKIFITATVTVESVDDREVIYLLDGHRFYKITYEHHLELKERVAMALNGWMIKENCFKTGKYSEENDLLELSFDNAEIERYDMAGPLIMKRGQPEVKLFNVTKEMKYFPESDGLFTDLVIAISECLNRERYKVNERHMDRVNGSGWGKGTVFLNFNEREPVSLQ